MALTVLQAVLLGAIQGPAELLPVSSSAHTELLPRLLGWDGYERLTPAERKSFAVALHAGSLGPLLAIGPRPGPLDALLMAAPGSLAGLLLERPIERRLGGIQATAAGLLAGSAVLLAADLTARRRQRPALTGRPPRRLLAAVGAAQTLGLLPGMSRLGAAVSAARLGGLGPHEAIALGRSAGLPLTAGAVALKAARLRRDGSSRELRAPLVAGALAAAAGTALAAPLSRRAPLRSAALWRAGLAVAALRQNVRR